MTDYFQVLGDKMTGAVEGQGRNKRREEKIKGQRRGRITGGARGEQTEDERRKEYVAFDPSNQMKA